MIINVQEKQYNLVRIKKGENYRALVKYCTTTKIWIVLDIHLYPFPDNCGNYSEEQGKRFHQDISEMEVDAKERTVRIMADFCWALKR